MLTISAERLRAITVKIFMATGAPEDSAGLMGDALVNSNLAGHDSHGVLRIPAYVASIQKGAMFPAARPAIIAETATTALVDGRWTFGHLAAHYATDVAVKKAKENRISLVSIVRCHHIGRLGEWAEQAAREDVIAIVTVGGGGSGRTAPYGGAAGAIGTNPISFGVPAGEMPMMVVDIATSAIAEGKIQVARAKNADLPPGTILDKHGQPSVKPSEFYDGGVLLPFGGHKGYSIGMVVELLCGALAPGNLYSDKGAHGAAIIVGIDTKTFRPDGSYGSVADHLLRNVKATPPAPGFSEVLLPGEPELRAREQRLREGIPVPEATWDAIVEAGRRVGLDVTAVV